MKEKIIEKEKNSLGQIAKKQISECRQIRAALSLLDTELGDPVCLNDIDVGPAPPTPTPPAPTPTPEPDPIPSGTCAHDLTTCQADLASCKRDLRTIADDFAIEQREHERKLSECAFEIEQRMATNADLRTELAQTREQLLAARLEVDLPHHYRNFNTTN